MRIAGFTMITDPLHRQDPWRQWLEQALIIFDEVVVVYGKETDKKLLDEYAHHGNLHIKYLHWPQPEWSYTELPRHLNAGLDECYKLDCDWAIKMDVDYFIHEGNYFHLRRRLYEQNQEGAIISKFEKCQFFRPERGYLKGDLHIGLNIGKNKRLGYGIADGIQNDLCQPIIKVGQPIEGVFEGPAIDKKLIDRNGIWIWNYNYTFKQEERAKKLLYYFDLAHAKFWGTSYRGRRIDEITPDTALEDFIALSKDRYKKMNLKISIKRHPLFIKHTLQDISGKEFGFKLWGKIDI